MKSGRVNFCPGELFVKLLAQIGEWHQNFSEKTDLLIWIESGEDFVRFEVHYISVAKSIKGERGKTQEQWNFS